MSLQRFEVMLPIDVIDTSGGFDMVELSGVSNLSGEYGPLMELSDEISVAAPSNFDPDNFILLVWGKPGWDNTDGNQHIFHLARGDADNYIQLSKEADDSLLARVQYHGKNFDASATLSFSNGDWIYVAMQLDGLGSKVKLYADTDGDNTLETAESSEQVGVFYPKISSGRVMLDTQDQGLRFVKSSGRFHIEDGSPAGGAVALIQRNGRFQPFVPS